MWEKERATQSLQRLWDYAAFSAVVFFFRTSTSVWGLIRWTCCCVLQPWSDLPDRWLGDIKSLLSAGAGPESGGGDGWMDRWTWRGVCVLGLVVCFGGCSWVWGDLVLSRSPPQIVKHTLISTGWDMDRLAYITDNHKPATALYSDDIWGWGELDSAASKVHNITIMTATDSRTQGLVGQQTHQPPKSWLNLNHSYIIQFS